MAATTALMPSTSSTTNGSARLKLDNGNDRMGHGSDSDGQSSLEHRTSSDEDEMTEQPPTSATGNTLTQPLTSDDDEDEDALKEIDEPVHQQNSNLLRNQMDSANNDSMASSEDETIVDDNSGGSFSNQIKSLGDKQIAAQLSSLSSLINLKSNTTSDTTANRPRQATGKLAKITERLAQRQNGVSAIVPPLPSAPPPPFLMSSCSSSSTESNENRNAIAAAAALNELDEEDEEQIKNGFRALGLMGNVAFLGDESFKCPVCGIKLDSQHTFTLHIRSHNPNDHSNTCSLCGKTLSSASSLDRHMLIHSGERPFKCTLCGMAFTTNGNMHRHMRTHGHGSIGYTPRGQKRRAKLLSQALEKAAAAAAAGEPVDMAAITKLKKSVLESSTVPSTPSVSSPSSGHVLKKRLKEHHSLSPEQFHSPNVSIEAAAAAAVAAAAANNHNAIKTNKLQPTLPQQHSPSNSHSQNSKYSSKPSQSSSGALGGGNDHHIPLNLAGKHWPSDPLYESLVKGNGGHERGKPGRKKKHRFPYPIPQQQKPFELLAPTGAPSPPSFNINAPSQCPICSHSVRNKMDLHIHMASLHPGEKLFCLDCGMILTNYNTYTQHHCTATAAAVVAALAQNPNANSELLFRSTNTSRMNFSSARSMTFSGLGGLFGFPQTAADSLLSKSLKKSLSQQPYTKEPNPHPLIDLTLKHGGFPKNSNTVTNCGKCNRLFNNTNELKYHIETFCHECGVDCLTANNLFTHQFNHNMEKLPEFSKMDADKMQAFKTALSIFPNLLPLHSPPNSARDLSGRQRSASPVVHQKCSDKSLDLSVSADPIKSMSSMMGELKPDLADIQSIISMTKHATLSLPNSSNNNNNTGSNQLRPPISPNRASDAGNSAGAHRCSNGGEATNQPDSPASADSAAGVSNTLTNSEQHNSTTKTDLNEKKQAATAQQPTNGEFEDEDDVPTKRRRTNSTSSNDGHEEQTIGKPNGGCSSSTSSTDSPRFRCELCRLSFKSMNAFRRHNRGHTAEGGHSHACHLCPYKSLDKSTLIRHLRTHNGERPFQCAICKYAFTTKANCERHVRKRHRNLKSKNEIRSAMQYNRDMAATAAATKLVSEKIFIERDELPTSQDTICKQCSVDFGTNRELRAHLRVPNNPCSQQLKPFVCTICKIGFNTRNNCVRHIIKQHPSTIEVTEEEAAKVAEESMMIETGSSSSLSPSSNGHGHSFSGSLSSSDHLSESDSYSTYEEEMADVYAASKKQQRSPSKFSTTNSPTNSSFAALCQVAEQVTNGHPKTKEGSLLNLSKRNSSSLDSMDDSVLDLSCKK